MPNYKYDESPLAKQFRYYVLTKPDTRGRNCLHYAAQFGDKHFCTMIVEEARVLEILPEIIDVKDEDSMTPLYLLSEKGCRSVSLEKQDPDEVERIAVEKLLREIDQ
jgi:hypothetical protein